MLDCRDLYVWCICCTWRVKLCSSGLCTAPDPGGETLVCLCLPASAALGPWSAHKIDRFCCVQMYSDTYKNSFSMELTPGLHFTVKTHCSGLVYKKVRCPANSAQNIQVYKKNIKLVRDRFLWNLWRNIGSLWPPGFLSSSTTCRTDDTTADAAVGPGRGTISLWRAIYILRTSFSGPH